MPYDVLLLPGHPVGVYSRGGYTFHAKEPVRLDDHQITDQIRNDRWLSLRDVAPAAPPAPSAPPVPMIPVPAWLLAQMGDDVAAIADALEHCTGPFAALVTRETVPADEPEPEPEDTTRRRRRTADTAPEA